MSEWKTKADADEQYRDIVRKLAEMDDTDLLVSAGGYVCAFCACSNHDQDSDYNLNHKPDCLWLLAKKAVGE